MTKRPRGPSRKVEIPVSAELQELLAQVLPVGDGAAPTVVYVWVTGTAGWRKAVAHYPNGWRLNLNFDRHGKISSSSAVLSMKLKGHAPRPVEMAA